MQLFTLSRVLYIEQTETSVKNKRDEPASFKGGLSHDNPDWNDESPSMRKGKWTRLGIYSGRRGRFPYYGSRACFLALFFRLPDHVSTLGRSFF